MKTILLLLAGLLFSPILSHAQRWQEAWELLKLRQADTARKVIDADVETEPAKSLAMTWYVRGMVYKTLYDRDDAAERYRGENVDLKAFDAYKKAIELDKNKELTSGILEDILALAEDFTQRGLDLFEKAYDNREPETMARAARYLDCVEESFSLLGQRSVGIYKMLSDFGLDKKTLDVCRALAKDHSGRHDEAARLYEGLVREKVQDPAIYLQLKDYYFIRSQRGRALEVLAQGRKMLPKNLEISCAYAEILADTGRGTEAIRLMHELARANPDEAQPMVSAGFIEEKRGNQEKALNWYEKAVTQEPNDFLANFRLGKYYFKRAEEARTAKATQLYIKELQERSLTHVEAASQSDPRHPANLRIMLELYQSLNMTDKAALVKSQVN